MSGALPRDVCDRLYGLCTVHVDPGFTIIPGAVSRMTKEDREQLKGHNSSAIHSQMCVLEFMTRAAFNPQFKQDIGFSAAMQNTRNILECLVALDLELRQKD